MKLFEIFNSVDKKKALADFKKEKDFYRNAADRETSDADMIITQYEIGKISYKEAWNQLLLKGYGHYEYKLEAAKETKEFRKKHTN